jgi:hypothetical protein
MLMDHPPPNPAMPPRLHTVSAKGERRFEDLLEPTRRREQKRDRRVLLTATERSDELQITGGAN